MGRGRGASRPKSYMKSDTVTTKFRAQLSSLMDTISLTNVQYVRCIKPNSLKSHTIYDRQMVVEQLRCAGMIEAIRISRAAYPYRVTHLDFVERFGGLKTKAWLSRQGDQPAQKCAALLTALVGKQEANSKDKSFEIGRTKVYM